MGGGAGRTQSDYIRQIDSLGWAIWSHSVKVKGGEVNLLKAEYIAVEAVKLLFGFLQQIKEILFWW